MRKTPVIILASAVLCLTLAACGQQQAASTGAASQNSESGQAADSTASSAAAEGSASATGATGSAQAASAIDTVANDFAEDEDALVANYASKFTQETYEDAETGLSVTYNLFLPEGYDESASYPMVVFIADSSCAGADATRSLSQGRARSCGRPMNGRRPTPPSCACRPTPRRFWTTTAPTPPPSTSSSRSA